MRAHEHALTAYALERLGAVAGRAACSGRPRADDRGGVVSFAVDGIHPHDVGELLGRATCACARATTARSR